MLFYLLGKVRKKIAWLDYKLDNMDECGMQEVGNYKNAPMMRFVMSDILYVFQKGGWAIVIYNPDDW